MGLIWVHFLFSLYHRFPIACKVIPRTYGFGMAFPYQIIPNAMELLWNFAKYVEIPYTQDRIIWFCYGVVPCSSHTNHMEDVWNFTKYVANP